MIRRYFLNPARRFHWYWTTVSFHSYHQPCGHVNQSIQIAFPRLMRWSIWGNQSARKQFPQGHRLTYSLLIYIKSTVRSCLFRLVLFRLVPMAPMGRSRRNRQPIHSGFAGRAFFVSTRGHGARLHQGNPAGSVPAGPGATTTLQACGATTSGNRYPIFSWYSINADYDHS